MEKINVAELLKDCPKGMELDCTMYDNLYFDSLNADYYGTINCYTLIDGIKTSINFTKYGTFNNHAGAKCVIFPKGKTTWDGFVPPCQFKDGDVVRYSDCIAIFKEWGDATLFRTYVTAYLHGDSTIDVTIPLFGKSIKRETRFATEEEKQKLFDAIKANGYEWNEETKTLEKLIQPKFKVGDKITDKNKFIYRIIEITDKGYKLHDLKTTFITFEDADLYFVKVVDIFDINTLIPFESRVLVRNVDGDLWKPAIYGFPHSKGCYVVGGVYWGQCIPYEENKELLGTTNNPEEYGSR